MLRKAAEEEIRKYMDFSWRLSQDRRMSAFPTYTDGLKTRQEFEEIALRSLRDKDNPVLLFENEGEVLGWIQYYVLPEDRYLGFDSFNIRKDIPQAIDEFITCAKELYGGYEINFGFPKDNTSACMHLEKLGFPVYEESSVFVLHFKDYMPKPEDGHIIRVTEENWDAFRCLHDGQPDMYWNSGRLYEALQGKTKYPWQMYLYEEDGKAKGCIYFVYVRGMMEIFGCDYEEGRFDPDVFRALLVQALNRSKEDGLQHMTYFAEPEENAVVQETGLQFITDYVLYRTVL